MVVEILYVPGCPNYPAALIRLRAVLKSEAIDAAIREIPINDEATAQALLFPGSPTIRINGLDAEPGNQQTFGVACRLYSGGAGLPSKQALERAITAAKRS